MSSHVGAMQESCSALVNQLPFIRTGFASSSSSSCYHVFACFGLGSWFVLGALSGARFLASIIVPLAAMTFPD